MICLLAKGKYLLCGFIKNTLTTKTKCKQRFCVWKYNKVKNFVCYNSSNEFCKKSKEICRRCKLRAFKELLGSFWEILCFSTRALIFHRTFSVFVWLMIGKVFIVCLKRVKHFCLMSKKVKIDISSTFIKDYIQVERFVSFRMKRKWGEIFALWIMNEAFSVLVWNSFLIPDAAGTRNVFIICVHFFAPKSFRHLCEKREKNSCFVYENLFMI